jgi:hypothetical protein
LVDFRSPESDAMFSCPLTFRFVEVALPCMRRLPDVVALPETVRPPVTVPSPIVVDAVASMPPVKDTSDEVADERNGYAKVS